MALRYAGRCCECSRLVPAKERAWWDADVKTVTCLSCWHPVNGTEADAAQRPGSSEGGLQSATWKASKPPPPPHAAPFDSEETTASPPLSPRPQDSPSTSPAGPPACPKPDAPAGPLSEAGGSALREYQRLQLRREDGIRAKHPKLGSLILALSDEPQGTRAWKKGAVGEQKLAAKLDEVEGVRTLHDRRRPGTRANIDHIVICASGVYVIDTKRYTKGQIHSRDVGGWFRRNVRLFVGSRDCSKLVEAMAVQVEAVTAALGELAGQAQVIPVLCFVDGEWGLLAEPFTVDGVWVTWGKRLRKRLTNPGSLTATQIDAIARALECRLPPA